MCKVCQLKKAVKAALIHSVSTAGRPGTLLNSNPDMQDSMEALKEYVQLQLLARVAGGLFSEIDNLSIEVTNELIEKLECLGHEIVDFIVNPKYKDITYLVTIGITNKGVEKLLDGHEISLSDFKYSLHSPWGKGWAEEGCEVLFQTAIKGQEATTIDVPDELVDTLGTSFIVAKRAMKKLLSTLAKEEEFNKAYDKDTEEIDLSNIDVDSIDISDALHVLGND